MSESRSNYFHNKGGENNNIAPVIYASNVPDSSIGFELRNNKNYFFENLGNDIYKVSSSERKAEQEYLLQGMPKGAMHEAAVIANQYKIGIAVRPTGFLAHSGIESGDPTKAQEFKNKTSKEADIFLCDEISWMDLGSVVHYNPRVGWRSNSSRNRLNSYFHQNFHNAPTELEWQLKKKYIYEVRMKTLQSCKTRMTFWPERQAHWDILKKLFIDRAKEFDEEDYDYRFGHYSSRTYLSGPFIRLKIRDNINIIGDHDIFGFTANPSSDLYGMLIDSNIISNYDHVQKALQAAPTFQAQHGGIWNWEPRKAFEKSIKNKIMGDHSPPNGDPLIYILPNYRVHAVFFVPGKRRVDSVWDYPQAHSWLMKTYSGKEMDKIETDNFKYMQKMFS